MEFLGGIFDGLSGGLSSLFGGNFNNNMMSGQGMLSSFGRAGGSPGIDISNSIGSSFNAPTEQSSFLTPNNVESRPAKLNGSLPKYGSFVDGKYHRPSLKYPGKLLTEADIPRVGGTQGTPTMGESPITTYNQATSASATQPETVPQIGDVQQQLGRNPAINIMPTYLQPPESRMVVQPPLANIGNQLKPSTSTTAAPPQQESQETTIQQEQMPAVSKSVEQFNRTFPSAADGVSTAFADNAPFLEKYGITEGPRRDHFMAQMAHESGGFKHLEEIGSGKKYEGRKDLGNTEPGDGNRFKGRGIIQLTGRANYKAYGDKLGIDLVNNPELAANPDVAVKIAAVYWHDNKLNALADKGDIKSITKRINGGLNGFNDRKRWLSKLGNVNEHL